MMGTQNHGANASTPSPYDIREAEGRDDAFYVRRQLDHYFGTECEPGYLPWELAERMGWADDDAPPIEVSVPIAEHEDVAVGCGLAAAKEREATLEMMPTGRFDADQLAADWNGWMMLGVVDPAWRGRGIGSELFKYRLRFLRAQGVSMVFGYGWEREDGPSSRSLFERHGFVPIQRFEDYYATEGDRDSCPDCSVWRGDDNVCTCETTFWALDGDDIDVRGLEP